MGIFDRFRRRSVADSDTPASNYLASSYINVETGAGTSSDKGGGGYYALRYWSNRYHLEAIAEESWAARKVITIPVVDCFNRWREWDVDEEDTQLADYEREMNVRETFRRLMLVARRYGTALGVLMTSEDRTDTPLEVERIKPDDFKGMLILDRFDAAVVQWANDYWEPDQYGHPEMYQITPRNGGQTLEVHHSRVLRFDGLERPVPQNDGMRYWGSPVIQHVLDAILMEDSAAAAAAHLIEEANTRVVTFGDEEFDSRTGRSSRIKEYVGNIAQSIGIRRTVALPEGSKLHNETYTFAGIKDMLERQSMRVAAAADIPYTRFMSKSPDGMNATGQLDDANYARVVRAEQERLMPLLDRFDEIAMRSWGYAMPEDDMPKYSFPSLTESSAGDRAQAELAKVQALEIAWKMDAVGSEEVRHRLSGSETFGELEGPPPEDTGKSREPDIGELSAWPEAGKKEEDDTSDDDGSED